MFEEIKKIGRFDRSYLPELKEKVFFEGESTNISLFNYVILLTLSTIISTYGVISGSSGTVIGAMIIAPLMTPIMATTLAIVMGDSRRISVSLGIVVLSTIYVIILAILLSLWVSPMGIDFKINQEILPMSSPDIFALFVALASGAAGAFAICRKNINDTLPGVAIAISLVLPLTVVGISTAKGQWSDVIGSLLLFLTNFFAILVAGGAVMWISGVNPGWIDEKQSKTRRKTFLIAVICTIIIAIPLFFSGLDTLNHAKNNHDALLMTNEWLSGTTYRVDTYFFHQPNYTVTIFGSGNVPPLNNLETMLESKFKTPVKVEVRVIPETILSIQPKNL
jgi:uncharacterized hydrophobic protein (TIGR00271 family)